MLSQGRSEVEDGRELFFVLFLYFELLISIASANYM